MREIQALKRQQASLLAMSWWKHVRETFTYKGEQKKVKDFCVTKDQKVCFLLQVHKGLDTLYSLHEWRIRWRVADTTHASCLFQNATKQKYNLRTYWPVRWIQTFCPTEREFTMGMEIYIYRDSSVIRLAVDGWTWTKKFWDHILSLTPR